MSYTGYRMVGSTVTKVYLRAIHLIFFHDSFLCSFEVLKLKNSVNIIYAK